MTDTTNAAQQDTAATDASADPTNRVLNPETGQGAKNFQGFSTKDGEIQAPPGLVPGADALNTSTKKPDSTKKPNDANDKSKRDPERRIGQAVARQRAAERQRDMLQAQLAAIQTGKTVDKPGATTVVDDPAPDATKYEFGPQDARYIRDKARYDTLLEIKTKQVKDAQTTQEQQRNAAATAQAAQLEEWLEAVPDKYDDFNDVVVEGAKNKVWPLSETLGALILESPVGHDVAYALASAPDEAKRINKLSAARQAAWFGTEEAKFLSEAGSDGTTKGQAETRQRVVSGAPKVPDHQARGNGTTEPVKADTTSFADFEKLAMAATARR